MAEATNDRRTRTSAPKRGKQRTQGWIRMHTDNKTMPELDNAEADKQEQSKNKPRDRRILKEVENS